MKHTLIPVSCALSALLTLLAPGVSQAAPISPVTEYTSQTAFAAAATNLTTINFQSANPNSPYFYTGYDMAAGLTIQGVNFVGTYDGGSQYGLVVNGPDFYPTYEGFPGNPNVLQTGGNNPVTTATLPAGTTAVGMNLYTLAYGDGYNNTVAPVDITLYSGATNLGTFVIQTDEKPTLAFAGFTSTQPITGLTIVPEGGTLSNEANFVFGNAAGSAPVNAGATITVTARASAADAQGRRTITVTTTNNGKTNADLLTLTSVTLGGPQSTPGVPTTPNLLAPGQSQTNQFSFSPSPGTTRLVLSVGGTYRDPNNNATDHFTSSIRLSLP